MQKYVTASLFAELVQFYASKNWWHYLSFWHWFVHLSCMNCFVHLIIYTLIIIEPPHDQTDKMAYVPSEASDQPGHPPRLIRVFTSVWRKLGSLATHWAHSEDSDQTGRMPMLIWVFAGRTCHFVGFDVRSSTYMSTSGKQIRWVFDDNLGIIFNISP